MNSVQNNTYRLVERDLYTTLFYNSVPVGAIVNIKDRWVTKIKNCADDLVICGRHADRKNALARLWECRFDAWHPLSGGARTKDFRGQPAQR
ncbi:hypothetical protein [Intestinirhabdus alba]|jgi:hypothetical protein|uniref:Uncharacterized protein n=1 Tax=Intestinirhabdus alba TaxID=2899544 RepID=A0A6L6ILY0_9ENTR|nr:hypothetical protein [Intestinirhabdus alba]MTH46596.1 hypothetical protein [Intestinirhabdus alba]